MTDIHGGSSHLNCSHLESASEISPEVCLHGDSKFTCGFSLVSYLGLSVCLSGVHYVHVARFAGIIPPYHAL